MDTNQSRPGAQSPQPLDALPAAERSASDDLLGSFIFGPAEPAPQAPAARVAARTAPPLKLIVKGLTPGERELLESLVKVSQRRSPRLEILADKQATEADVIVIDALDAAAIAWAGQHPWLDRRAVIWIDGTGAPNGHTLLPRPVQWPVLPMVLARALEAGPGTAAAVAPSAAYAAAAIAEPPLRAPQILVVDDSPAVRAQLRSLLEPGGFVVTDVDGVDAALQALDRRAFDCVLMDVMMPGTDGYEGCRQFKARLRGANAVPVVMLTSRGSPFDRLSGKMAGCDAYLTKPVDPEHLNEVLAQLLSGMPQHRPAPVPASGTDLPPAKRAASLATTRPR